jgi:CubicO group peptidase (beta-lactamase class C family)
VLANPPENRPGSTFGCSNTGYVLAGLMAEQVSDQSWEMLMRRRLCEPLVMSTAGFGSPGQPGSVDQPWGHRAVGGQVEPTQADNAPALGPAGTVHCSIQDWSKFAALHEWGPSAAR